MGSNIFLLFGEFVSSNNFLLLLAQKFNLLSPSLSLGIYFQGIPIQPTVDFVWGTNAGIRTLPVLLFLTLLQTFFNSFWSLAYLIIILLLPFLFFLLAVRSIKKIDVWVITAALFYAGNPWIIDRLSSGFWQLNLVYAFLPFLITLPLQIVESKTKSIKEIAYFSSFFSIFSSIVMIAQPHFLVMILPYWLILFLIALIRKQNRFQLIIFYSITLVLFALINTYFLLPSSLYPEEVFTSPQQYFSLASVSFNGSGSTLEHVLAFSPLGALDKSQPVPIVQFVFISLTVFTFLIKRKSKPIIFGALLLFYIFLAKGLNQPFQSFSRFLYESIPILHFFRDPPRFVGAMALFATFIIATYKYKLSSGGKGLLITGVLLVIILSNSNFISHKATLLTSQTTLPSEYLLAQKILAKEGNSSSRILTIPNNTSYSDYPFYKGKLSPPSHTVFDMAIPLPLALANSNYYADTFSSQISAYLTEEFIKTKNFQVLNPLDVSYILIDHQVESPLRQQIDDLKLSIDKNTAQLINQNKVFSLYKLSRANSQVTSEAPIYGVGDFSLIAELAKKGNTAPVILLNQTINRNLPLVPQRNGLVTNIQSPILTLTSERLADKYAVNILKDVWDYDKSFVNCEPEKIKFIQSDGNLFTSGMCVETGYLVSPTYIKVNIPKGKYKILLKSLSRGSTYLNISFDNKTIKHAFNTREKLIWEDLGNYEVSNNLNSIKLEPIDKNQIVIDYLLFVPFKKYNSEFSNISKLFPSIKAVNQFTIPHQSDNTKYSISVDSVAVKKPVKTITDRYSYGKYWTSNNASNKYISDGYGMTFIAKNALLLDLSYFPNTVYQLSLITSLLTIVFLVIFVITYRIKCRRKTFSLHNYIQGINSSFYTSQRYYRSLSSRIRDLLEQRRTH